MLLVGCDNKFNEIKDAVTGIDDQAEKAAKAISYDAHTIRAVKINYKNTSFTINDLFKTILRDTQWEYEQNGSIHTLTVKGTWKEPLFEQDQLNIDRNKLIEKGKVIVQLQIENDKVIEDKTKVVLQMGGKKLLDEQGEKILSNLYDIYINNIKK